MSAALPLFCLRPAAAGSAWAVAALLLCSTPTLAQRVEAARYVTEQGVEVLVNRNAPKPRDAGPGVPATQGVAGAAAGAAVAAVVGTPSVVTTTAALSMARAEQRVGSAEQAGRDVERQRILTQELLSEGQQLEVKRKALKSPRVEIDLSADARHKLASDVQRHEANLAALGREMARFGASPARALPVNVRTAPGAESKPPTRP